MMNSRKLYESAQDSLDSIGQYWTTKNRWRLTFIAFLFNIIILTYETVNRRSSNSSTDDSLSPLLYSLFVGLEIFMLLLTLWFLMFSCIDLYKAEKLFLSFDSCLSSLLLGWIIAKLSYASNDNQPVLVAIAILLDTIIYIVDYTTQRLKMSSKKNTNLLQFYRQQVSKSTSGEMDVSRTGLESIYTIQNDFQAISPAQHDDHDDVRIDMKNGDSQSNSKDRNGTAPSSTSGSGMGLGLGARLGLGGRGSSALTKRDMATTAVDLSLSQSVAGISIDIQDPSDIEFDGFRVKLSSLPPGATSSVENVSWESFEFIEHRIDSSSCHIYTAFWQGIPVIIKLIKADRVNSPMAVAEFEMEATILSRVQHPHVVRLLGSGVLPRRFLILELLDGGSLSHALGIRPDANKRYVKKKITYKDTLIMARSIASALDYLHNRWNPHIHIIHRDLKPDNIGWTSDGQLKVFDFGLCTCVRTHRDRKESYRLTGNTGTLRYMAPEVALGRSYNKSVDTYSFGIILWQVIRMQLPFKHMHKKDYMEKVVIGGQRPPLDRHWPKRLRELLEGCWHEDKAARPDFGYVLQEIEGLLQEVEEMEKSPFNRLRRGVEHLQLFIVRTVVWCRPGVLAVAMAVFVLGLVLLGLASSASRSRYSDQIATLGISLVVIAAFACHHSLMSLIRGSSRRPLSSRDLIMGLELNQSPVSKNFNPMSKEGPSSKQLYGL